MNPEYFNTWFRDCDFARFSSADFAIVTAHNPAGRTFSTDENRVRNENLAKTLAELQIPYTSIEAGSSDFGYSESSFLIACDAETAIAIAGSYEQEAIFMVQQETLYLVDCQTAHFHYVAPWQSRLIINDQA